MYIDFDLRIMVLLSHSYIVYQVVGGGVTWANVLK
jgi:hypothetical protein